MSKFDWKKTWGLYVLFGGIYIFHLFLLPLFEILTIKSIEHQLDLMHVHGVKSALSDLSKTYREALLRVCEEKVQPQIISHESVLVILLTFASFIVGKNYSERLREEVLVAVRLVGVSLSGALVIAAWLATFSIGDERFAFPFFLVGVSVFLVLGAYGSLVDNLFVVIGHDSFFTFCKKIGNNILPSCAGLGIGISWAIVLSLFCFVMLVYGVALRLALIFVDRPTNQARLLEILKFPSRIYL